MKMQPTFGGVHFFEKHQLRALPKLDNLVKTLLFDDWDRVVPPQVLASDPDASLRGGTMDNLLVIDLTGSNATTGETPLDRFVTEQTRQIAQEAGGSADSFYRFVPKSMSGIGRNTDVMSSNEVAEVVKQLPLRPKGSGWSVGGMIGIDLYARVQELLSKSISNFEMSPIAQRHLS